MATQQYTLEKPVWTEADFDNMGWHDVHVHAGCQLGSESSSPSFFSGSLHLSLR